MISHQSVCTHSYDISSTDFSQYIEPLYNDYRKMRRMNKLGGMRFVTLCASFISIALAVLEVYHMDEFAESLLHDDRVCDIQMPAMQVYMIACHRIG